MDRLTWYQLLLLVCAYWVVLVGGWYVYTTRPVTQRQTRARNLVSIIEDSSSATATMTFKHQINLVRVGAALLGPPFVLLVAWLIA
ncbi:MAG: hypothetical protein ACRENP_07230 [Longimicrobiales bacterium]